MPFTAAFLNSNLVNRGINVVKVISGTFMTSLNAPGFSITLLNATSQMLKYLEAPASAIGWSQNTSGAKRPKGQQAVYEEESKQLNGIENPVSRGWKRMIHQLFN
jgi:dihydroxyacetone kinase